jgi:molecular chaperone HscB
LTPRFDIDLSVLEQQFFDLQRRLHPDVYAKEGGTSLALSQQQAASLNDAYEVLTNPTARAAALLTAKGRDVPGQDTHTVHDPALLMEAMEMREALSEAESVDAIKPLIKQTRAQAASCEADLGAAFGREDFEAATSLMLRLRYLLKMNDEIRSRRAKLARRA